jgi:hypothetical protein
MEIGELVATPSLLQEYKEKCPFKEEKEDAPKNADESIPDDDDDGVQQAQANDGGILGENLLGGSAGVADGGPFPATDFLFRQPADDSSRGRMTRLRLSEFKDAKAGDFPFTVAAHHLIPGNASLYKDEVKLINYMKEGGKVKSAAGNSYTLSGHIGYDVNGSHNAVWLPGNYAIKTALPERRKGDKTLPAREGTTPVEGVSWRMLQDDHEDWQFDYVAGACKAGGGQFHDTHECPYSASVRKNLTKIVYALAVHLDYCEDCIKRGQDSKELPPPYRLKRRLYAMSARLRGFVSGPPDAWKLPWFTSERWSTKFFENGKVTDEFRRRYITAVETKPHAVPL